MNRLLTTSCLASVLVLGACNNEEPQTPAPAQVETTPSAPEQPAAPSIADRAREGLDGAMNRADDLVDEAAEMFGNSKDQAVEAVESRLAQVRPEVERLRTKGAELTGQAKDAFESVMADLQSQMDNLDVKFAELRESGADTWKSIASELGAAFERLSSSLGEARRLVGESPAGGS